MTSSIIVLALGFLFGALMQRGRLNRYDTIAGMATLEDFKVAKALLVAIGLGMILLAAEIAMGGASWHIKPLLVGGVSLGGLVFGAGMAILGYCPGTLAVSVGEGSLDAMVGVIGGLLGGLVYTLSLPVITPLLGPDLGKLSLFSLLNGGTPWLIASAVIGAALVGGAFLLPKRGARTGLGWLSVGAGLAFLDVVVFSSAVTNRPIGASTSYPYVADLLTGLTSNAYYEKITTPGHWELVFLTGSMLAAFVLSLATRELKPSFIHERWRHYKGDSVMKRIVWSLIGGFLLIYGARMAGGCTSGHVLSGGMQGAVSSWIFAVFVFAGLLGVGKVFYRPGRS